MRMIRSTRRSCAGLALGMALIMYARQEAADELINGLLEDADPALRYGGILTVALAYCGSGSNKAVRKLLHVAVSDVSDDVRRAAVMSLGFVLFRKPGSVPRMVELLSESYNPHVRYGATMALGIACAGTGLDEAIDLLEPMMKDSVDFVRQGALISLAMIMVQQNESHEPQRLKHPQTTPENHRRPPRRRDGEIRLRARPRHHRRWRPQLHHRSADANRQPQYGGYRRHGGVHTVLVLVPTHAFPELDVHADEHHGR